MRFSDLYRFTDGAWNADWTTCPVLPASTLVETRSMASLSMLDSPSLPVLLATPSGLVRRVDLADLSHLDDRLNDRHKVELREKSA